jgi:hypothetical protein
LRHNETDGEICAVADPDDDDDNSAANHIEKVGAQRCGEQYPENPQSSQCKFKKKEKKNGILLIFLREKRTFTAIVILLSVCTCIVFAVTQLHLV